MLIKILKMIYHTLAITIISLLFIFIIIIIFAKDSKQKKPWELNINKLESDIISLPFAESRKEFPHAFDSIVASVTVKGSGLKNEYIFLNEEPNDEVTLIPILKPAKSKTGKMQSIMIPCWPKGEGSIIRFNGTIYIQEDYWGKNFNNILIEYLQESKLIIKKEKRGWVYVSGKGNITYKYGDKIVFTKNF